MESDGFSPWPPKAKAFGLLDKIFTTTDFSTTLSQRALKT